MYTVFGLLTGLCWSIAYVLLFRAGVRERTYGMPVVAFATNICWEFIFAFTRSGDAATRTVAALWFVLDCGVGYTIVRYGPREFPQLPRKMFYGGLFLCLVLAYPGLSLFSDRFDAGTGTYLAFLTNLVMSGCFLSMLLGRRSTRGQSVSIAVAKMLGTVFASLTHITEPHEAARYEGGLLPYLYVSCFVLDLGYVCLLAALKARGPDTSHEESRLPVGR